MTILGRSKYITLITGGAGGLGSALSRKLASEGHSVIVNYRSSEYEALKLKDELGDQCRLVRADISSRDEVRDMAHHIEKSFGRLDNLINNAGISEDCLLIRFPEEKWDSIIDINLKGCFNCIQVMFPLMKDTGGHIVNISSYSGVKGREGQCAYSASKAGIIGFSRSLAKEMSRFRIRVNTVLPGYMETRMGKGTGHAIELAIKESILNTLSDPDEVAGFVSYLCTTKNITGQVFFLDSRIT
ncbi:3-oxoacyl-[acyl-carrier-protein] reductase FabG [bacterium BMS3Abin07]|nr:3-oxoacyl-[acyl-carrier-protein] reductase FabG [bacterium BMS3Abin07]GBE32525.1 3-oxoacyl-[acyl-carrier-protein] reductase FabG [bacterium BMS3Bbin05]HDO23428.1 SDR family NAD(P)-dependent oxidoreductase [Nitrospirota bacterium]HDZ88076.1 SDR family NAD(P)-dependent oxidoreductase [Nitrospirota bacterium]